MYNINKIKKLIEVGANKIIVQYSNIEEAQDLKKAKIGKNNFIGTTSKDHLSELENRIMKKNLDVAILYANNKFNESYTEIEELNRIIETLPDNMSLILICNDNTEIPINVRGKFLSELYSA